MKKELSDGALKKYSKYISQDLIDGVRPVPAEAGAEQKSGAGVKDRGWQRWGLTAAVFIAALTLTGVILLVNRAVKKNGTEQGDTHSMEETPAATDTSEDPGTTPEPAAFKGDKYTLLVPQWPDNRSPEMVALTDRKTIDMLSIADFSGRILYGLPDEVQIDRSGNFMLLYQTWIPALYQPPAMNMDARMYVLLRCTGSACEADSNQQDGQSRELILTVNNFEYRNEDQSILYGEDSVENLPRYYLGKDGNPIDAEKMAEYVNRTISGKKMGPAEIRLLRQPDGGFVLTGIDYDQYPGVNLTYYDNRSLKTIEVKRKNCKNSAFFNEEAVLTKFEIVYDDTGAVLTCDLHREGRADGKFNLIAERHSGGETKTFRYNDEGVELGYRMLSYDGYIIKTEAEAKTRSLQPYELKSAYIPMWSMNEAAGENVAASKQLQGLIDPQGHIYVKVTEPEWSQQYYAIRVLCDADAEELLNSPELKDTPLPVENARKYSETFVLMNMLCQYSRMRLLASYKAYNAYGPGLDGMGKVQKVLYFTDERIVNCCAVFEPWQDGSRAVKKIHSMAGNEWAKKPWLEYSDSEADIEAYLNRLKATVMDAEDNYF